MDLPEFGESTYSFFSGCSPIFLQYSFPARFAAQTAGVGKNVEIFFHTTQLLGILIYVHGILFRVILTQNLM